MARSKPQLCVGVDAARGGWLAVSLLGGRFRDARLHATFAALLEASAGAAAIGVDIPIGLKDSGRRTADALARALLRRRRATVFEIPPRSVLEAPSYAAARKLAPSLFGCGVSAQAYALGARILEVDRLTSQPGPPLIEVHPEVTFRELAGRLLGATKKTWDGVWERRRLLEARGIELPERLGDAGCVAPDDVLDAAAAAWSANRYARGEAVSLPSPPERDPSGRLMAIWY